MIQATLTTWECMFSHLWSYEYDTTESHYHLSISFSVNSTVFTIKISLLEICIIKNHNWTCVIYLAGLRITAQPLKDNYRQTKNGMILISIHVQYACLLSHWMSCANTLSLLFIILYQNRTYILNNPRRQTDTNTQKSRKYGKFFFETMNKTKWTIYNLLCLNCPQ